MQHVRLRARCKAIAGVWAAHCLQAFGHALGIAVLAACAHLGAASGRVPASIRPFNCAGRVMPHPLRWAGLLGLLAGRPLLLLAVPLGPLLAGQLAVLLLGGLFAW